MASKSKKKSTSKKTTGKTTKKAGENFVIDEIIIWIVLAVSILLLISNFGFGGTLGASASAFLMESFGAGAYLVPFLLFGVTAFLVSNKHNRIAYWKSGAAVICFLILCGLFPKLAALISIMPQSVLGGAAVMMFSSIVISGIQLITKEPMTMRNITIVSVALGLGYGIGSSSGILAHLPQGIQLIFGGSGIVPAAIVAIIFNIILPKDAE